MAKWRDKSFLYDQEIADELCSRVANGEHLPYVCKFDDVGIEREPGSFPTIGTVQSWTRIGASNYNAEFTALFAEAMIIGQHVYVWETLQIADTPEYGEETTEETVDVDGEKPYTRTVTRVVKKEMIAHRTLRINTRLKVAAMFNPTLWSDKLRKAEEDGGDIVVHGGLF